MDAGTLVLVHLVQPKEKYWGVLLALGPAGVTLRGLERRPVRRLGPPAEARRRRGAGRRDALRPPPPDREAVRGRARRKRRELRRALLRHRGLGRSALPRPAGGGRRRALHVPPELTAGQLLGLFPTARGGCRPSRTGGRTRRGSRAHRRRASSFTSFTPAALSLREHGVDVVHVEAQVVDSRAALLDRLRDRPVGRRRLEELEVRLPHRPERRHDLLRRDLLAVLLEEAEEVPERAAASARDFTAMPRWEIRETRSGGFGPGDFGAGDSEPGIS